MATITPNMLLKVFNLATDLYDYNAVANDWIAVDQHDHSNGKGVQIGTAGLQNGAVTLSKLDPGVTSFILSVPQSPVPTGAILDFGGATAPFGYVLCDGSVYSSTDPNYSTLYSIVALTYNTGGEGAGNFRVPDLRQRFALGKAQSGTGSTLGATGGLIDHGHSIPSMTTSAVNLTVPGLSIPDLTLFAGVANHTHGLTNNAGAALRAAGVAGVNLNNGLTDALTIFSAGNGPTFTATGYAYESGGAVGQQGSGSFGPMSSYGLVGSTEGSSPSVNGIALGASAGQKTGGGTISNVTSTIPGGTYSTGTNNPPYQVVNKIIKL